MTETNAAHLSESALPYSLDYPPPDFIDPVIEVYKKDVDRTSLRENLKLTMDERLRKAPAQAVAMAASHARLAELDEFHQFTSSLLMATTEPLTLAEYFSLWREDRQRQASILGRT